MRKSRTCCRCAGASRNATSHVSEPRGASATLGRMPHSLPARSEACTMPRRAQSCCVRDAAASATATRVHGMRTRRLRAAAACAAAVQRSTMPDRALHLCHAVGARLAPSQASQARRFALRALSRTRLRSRRRRARRVCCCCVTARRFRTPPPLSRWLRTRLRGDAIRHVARPAAAAVALRPPCLDATLHALAQARGRQVARLTLAGQDVGLIRAGLIRGFQVVRYQAWSEEYSSSWRYQD